MSETRATMPDAQPDDHADAASNAATSASGGGSRLALLVRLARPLVGLSIIIAIVVLINPAGFIAELDDWREWIDGLGLLGIGLFLAVCVLAAILLVPVSLVTIAAGGLYGGVVGVVIASVGGALGATACMVIARFALRGAPATWLVRRPWHRRLTRMVERRGPLVVAGVRMIPILPGNLLNYAMGMVRIDLPRYMLWTWLGSLPSTVVLVVGTDALVQSLMARDVTWGPIFIAAGALLLIIALSMWAGRSLQDVTDSGEGDGEPESDAPIASAEPVRAHS